MAAMVVECGGIYFPGWKFLEVVSSGLDSAFDHPGAVVVWFHSAF